MPADSFNPYDKNPYRVIPHPRTGEEHFAIFPEIRGRGFHFPEAPIYLYYGMDDRERNVGYGLVHIHARHYSHRSEQLVDVWLNICNVLADVLSEGSAIHLDVQHQDRLVVIRTRENRRLILKHLRSPDRYSIVTYFWADGSKRKGPYVGTFR